MKAKSTKKITNKKAFHDYAILDRFEAGIELKGSEVKSIRAGEANLTGSYVKFVNGEAFILGMHISPYRNSSFDRVDPVRERKLLLHNREIRKLNNNVLEKNLTVIPLTLYFKRNFVKAEIALVKGRKLYDKREALKKKSSQREIREK